MLPGAVKVSEQVVAGPLGAFFLGAAGALALGRDGTDTLQRRPTFPEQVLLQAEEENSCGLLRIEPDSDAQYRHTSLTWSLKIYKAMPIIDLYP